MSKKTKKINLKIISVVLLVSGIIYLIAGITIAALWEYIQADEWGIVMLIEGIFFMWTACGLIIKQLLPQKKLITCLLIGYLTAFLGVIAALIIKHLNKKDSSSLDKYDQLKKLQDLKDQGIITEEEFKAEKNKILE